MTWIHDWILTNNFSGFEAEVDSEKCEITPTCTVGHKTQNFVSTCESLAVPPEERRITDPACMKSDSQNSVCRNTACFTGDIDLNFKCVDTVGMGAKSDLEIAFKKNYHI